MQPGPPSERDLQRNTLSAVLGAHEAVNTLEHELIVALVTGNERVDRVEPSQWTAVLNAALALETVIVTVLDKASPNTATNVVALIEEARRSIDDRLSDERPTYHVRDRAPRDLGHVAVRAPDRPSGLAHRAVRRLRASCRYLGEG